MEQLPALLAILATVAIRMIDVRERRWDRRRDLRERRDDQAASAVGALDAFIQDANPYRLTLLVSAEQSRERRQDLGERWRSLRVTLLTVKAVHPDPRVRDATGEVIQAVAKSVTEADMFAEEIMGHHAETQTVTHDQATASHKDAQAAFVRWAAAIRGD